MKFDVVTFMENMARWCKLIGHTDNERHFYRVSGIQAIEEVLQNMGDNFSPALLVEDELEGQFADGLSDNVRDVRNFMFYVVKRSELQDMADRQTIIRECHAIVKQIIAVMFKYYKTDNKSALNTYGLRGLVKGSIAYFTLGPIGDNCFGIGCGFQINDSHDIAFDMTQWNIDPIAAPPEPDEE